MFPSLGHHITCISVLHRQEMTTLPSSLLKTLQSVSIVLRRHWRAFTHSVQSASSPIMLNHLHRTATHESPKSNGANQSRSFSSPFASLPYPSTSRMRLSPAFIRSPRFITILLGLFLTLYIFHSRSFTPKTLLDSKHDELVGRSISDIDVNRAHAHDIDLSLDNMRASAKRAAELKDVPVAANDLARNHDSDEDHLTTDHEHEQDHDVTHRAESHLEDFRSENNDQASGDALGALQLGADDDQDQISGPVEQKEDEDDTGDSADEKPSEHEVTENHGIDGDERDDDGNDDDNDDDADDDNNVNREEIKHSGEEVSVKNDLDDSDDTSVQRGNKDTINTSSDDKDDRSVDVSTQREVTDPSNSSTKNDDVDDNNNDKATDPSERIGNGNDHDNIDGGVATDKKGAGDEDDVDRAAITSDRKEEGDEDDVDRAATTLDRKENDDDATLGTKTDVESDRIDNREGAVISEKSEDTNVRDPLKANDGDNVNNANLDTFEKKKEDFVDTSIKGTDSNDSNITADREAEGIVDRETRGDDDNVDGSSDRSVSTEEKDSMPVSRSEEGDNGTEALTEKEEHDDARSSTKIRDDDDDDDGNLSEEAAKSSSLSRTDDIIDTGATDKHEDDDISLATRTEENTGSTLSTNNDSDDNDDADAHSRMEEQAGASVSTGGEDSDDEAVEPSSKTEQETETGVLTKNLDNDGDEVDSSDKEREENATDASANQDSHIGLSMSTKDEGEADSFLEREDKGNVRSEDEGGDTGDVDVSSKTEDHDDVGKLTNTDVGNNDNVMDTTTKENDNHGIVESTERKVDDGQSADVSGSLVKAGDDGDVASNTETKDLTLLEKTGVDVDVSERVASDHEDEDEQKQISERAEENVVKPSIDESMRTEGAETEVADDVASEKEASGNAVQLSSDLEVKHEDMPVSRENDENQDVDDESKARNVESGVTDPSTLEEGDHNSVGGPSVRTDALTAGQAEEEDSDGDGMDAVKADGRSSENLSDLVDLNAAKHLENDDEDGDDDDV